jgi:glucosamine kinase
MEGTAFWAGVDGGGTNCRAAIVDARGAVVGRGHADAANFLRVGLEAAVAHVGAAVEEACAEAGIEVARVG